MAYIDIKNLTKKYQDRSGIFDINLSIAKGECLGIIGINGAGKSTLIRHLMGFCKPRTGSITIDNLDAWKDAAKLKERIAYIPGEIGFPPASTGTAFLNHVAELEGVKKHYRTKELIKILNLDIDARLKTMSKGMKQKTAIIASFIKNKDILIFDEPTTGLDPLMRDAFVNLLLEQKALGKTIIFSTHIFLEAERVCNNVIFLNEGKIIDRVALNSIRFSDTKKYRIGFAKTEDVDSFVKTAKKLLINATKDAHSIQVIVQIANKNINQFMNILQNFSIKFITEIKPTLHAHFLKMLKNTTHSVV